MNRTCPLCGAPALRTLLDLGVQPLSNRFPTAPEEDRVRIPFVFGACADCGVARFLDPPPPETLRPEVDWIRYNEPEGHLDDLVANLVRLPGVTPDSRFLGISYKDASTLQRLRKMGYPHCDLLDLGITDPRAGIETIQARLAQWQGDARADVLVVRHVLEHAQDTRATAEGLQRLVRPGGWIVYEVPDNTRVFANREVCFLWEEHVLYLTPGTLRQTLSLLGYHIAWMNSYPYAVENALVAFVQPGGAAPARHPGVAASALAEAEAFVSTFEADRADLRVRLTALTADGQRIAAFGAGHLATKFVNFFHIEDWLAFVADDHPGKQCRILAGSGVPILPASALKDQHIDLALMSLNPESEERVLAKFQTELPGLSFRSMFRSSPRSFWSVARD